MNKRLPLLAFAASIAISLFAQAEPAVDMPAGRMACSVDMTPMPTADAPKGSPAPVRWIKHIDIIREGNLQRDMVTWSNGTLVEVWRVLDAQLLLAAKSTDYKGINIFPVGSSFAGDFSPRILALDSGSLSWIASNSLMGRENKDGKDVFHYRATVLVPGYLPHDPPRHVFYDAWIDAKTLAPVAFSDGDNLYKLTFAAAPSDPLILPDPFQKVLQYYQRANFIGRRL